MPTYCYSTDDGRTVERHFSMSDKPQEVTLEDGTVAKFDIGATHRGFRNTPDLYHGHTSTTLAVHPSQIAEAMALDKKLGVPVHYRSDGTPVYESKAQWQRHYRAHGYRDRSGFTD